MPSVPLAPPPPAAAPRCPLLLLPPALLAQHAIGPATVTLPSGAHLHARVLPAPPTAPRDAATLVAPPLHPAPASVAIEPLPPVSALPVLAAPTKIRLHRSGPLPTPPPRPLRLGRAFPVSQGALVPLTDNTYARLAVDDPPESPFVVDWDAAEVEVVAAPLQAAKDHPLTSGQLSAMQSLDAFLSLSQPAAPQAFTRVVGATVRGARGSGRTTLLRRRLPDAVHLAPSDILAPAFALPPTSRPVVTVLDDLDVALSTMPEAHPNRARALAVIAAALRGAADTPGWALIAVVSETFRLPVELAGVGLLEHEIEVALPVLADRRALFAALGTVPDADAAAAQTNGMSLRELKRFRARPAPELWASAQSAEMAGYDETRRVLLRTLRGLLSVEATTGPVYAAVFGGPSRRPGGVLLHGPTGCGKSLLTRWAAAELRDSDVAFVHVQCTSLLSKYLGESEAAIRRVFAQARRRRPCVIVLDEIDIIASKRDLSQTGAQGVSERMLSQLLNEMDGIDSSGELVVIGCTEHKDRLDPAVLRPGRMDHHFELGLPTQDERRAILDVVAKAVPIADRAATLDWLAGLPSLGKSGAGLAGMVRKAAMAAVREEATEVERRHLSSTFLF